jgi:hypothetical protein
MTIGFANIFGGSWDKNFTFLVAHGTKNDFFFGGSFLQIKYIPSYLPSASQHLIADIQCLVFFLFFFFFASQAGSETHAHNSSCPLQQRTPREFLQVQG